MDLNFQQIRDLRLRLGWSQAEFARQIGTTLERIQQIESGSQLSELELSICIKWYSDVDPICESIRRVPMAEKTMKDQGLSQVDHASVQAVLE